MLLVARVISGFSAALATGAGTAAIGEQLPASRKWLGPVLALLANMGGLASGTMLAGILAQWAGHPLRLSWIVDLALIGVSLVGLARSPKRSAAPGATFRFQRLEHPVTRSAASSSGRRPAAGAGFACSACSPR